LNVHLVWFAHNNAGAHFATKQMQIGDRLLIPNLVGDPPTKKSMTFSLPSHDDEGGAIGNHVGEFYLKFTEVDSDTKKFVRIFYPSCNQGNTAA